ncbi:MAG: ABC transporter permease [Steroidobacteraceae bacterium]
MYCVADRSDGILRLTLSGPWRAAALGSIERELTAQPLAGCRQLQLHSAQASFDLSGAWLLHDYVRRARAAGVDVQFSDGAPTPLPLIDKTLGRSEKPGDDSDEQTVERTLLAMPGDAVEGIGRRTVRYYQQLMSGLDFVGRTTLVLLRALLRPRRLRLTSVVRHVYDTGITAVPIVSLIAFLISVILAYMGAQQLRQFGADIFVVDLVTIGVLRELAVLLTAIIVAGRSGSAFAAEIGAMQLNEEVDALEATGVDPVEVLVLPRVLGLLIALPLLTLVADLIGLVGGALLCHALLDMPLTQYLNRASDSIANTTFWVGIVKAPVFAVLIGLAGTWYGMRVRGSSRQLGELTTAAVVAAIFLVILADALFAVLFMELDI